MSDPRPEELIRAEKLMDNGKVEEALEIITSFEKRDEITRKEQLWLLLLKAEVHGYKLQFKEVVELGEQAYQLSKELELVYESIEALYLKAFMVYIGKFDESIDLITKAEELFNFITKETNSRRSRINFFILTIKSWYYGVTGELTTALELALKALELVEITNFKLQHAYHLHMLGLIYSSRNEHNTALEYGMKSLKLMEEMEFQVGVAHQLWAVGYTHYFKGDLNKGIEFCKKSLSIPQISKRTKTNVLYNLGTTYIQKGELDLALDSFTQAIQLAEESSQYMLLTVCLSGIGSIHIMKNDYDQAEKYLNRSLELSQEAGIQMENIMSNFFLFFVNLENNFNKKALNYLENLRELTEQTQERTSVYLLAKAMMLIKKKRFRDKAEAEKLLKQIVEDENFRIEMYSILLVSLCDLLLEDLYESDDPEIIDELRPLIQRLLERAENQNSFSYLAEGKLLQAKLALIQMDLDGAKSLLTQAQQIAEKHGLNLLAQKISSEHDLLLEIIDKWDKLKKDNASMADRIELASFDGVIDRLQGKRAVDPPELVDEEPVLLLIMDNSGVPYFNYSFVSDWDIEGIFSSFMSAFNTFSSELFSKSIDRIRIGENVILINPIESFLACYVIKGQSYLALQKLTRFTEAIRENPAIWQALNKSVKTNEMLELDKPPALKTVIDEIF